MDLLSWLIGVLTPLIGLAIMYVSIMLYKNLFPNLAKRLNPENVPKISSFLKRNKDQRKTCKICGSSRRHLKTCPNAKKKEVKKD